MSERGVFAVDRGIWDHDVLAENSPYSRREAWLWLVSEAAWKPHRRRIIGRIIELERGELVASLRFIAAKWRWSEARVRRFLSALISESMIDAKTDAGVTKITICKYDEYQRVSLPDDAMRESDDDAGATQERRKVEDKENKEEDSDAYASGAGAPPDPSIAERDYFERGKAVGGKSCGGLLNKILITRGRNIALARAVVELASTKQNPLEWLAKAAQGPPVSSFPQTAKEVHRDKWRTAYERHKDAVSNDGGSSEIEASGAICEPPVRLLSDRGGGRP